MSVLVGELVEYQGPMSGREEGDSVSSSYVGGGGRVSRYPGYPCWEYPGPCCEEGLGEGVGEGVGGRSRVLRSHVCWVPGHVTYPMT